jgi:uncharacterized protein (TIGR02270 family)
LAHAELFSHHPSRASIRAAGGAGVPELVPHLLDCVSHPHLCRLAADALVEITGVDLQKEGLTLEAPPETEGPTESPLDDATELDADEGLLWPAKAAVDRWWATHSSHFAPLTRHLTGTTINAASLRQLLVAGPQKRRGAAAELLAFSGLPLFDVCAPAFRQAHRLSTEDAWR